MKLTEPITQIKPVVLNGDASTREADGTVLPQLVSVLFSKEGGVLVFCRKSMSSMFLKSSAMPSMKVISSKR